MIEPSGRPLFRILGPLEVWNGREWAQVGAPKWRALLATLLLSPGQPVATGRLIDALWGEHPPAKASNLVSLYVYRLRRLIGDAGGRVLVTRAPGYQIMLSPGGLDAESFARLVAAGRTALAGDDPARAADLLGAALDLWRGPALADVLATALVAAEADRLEESRVQALELRSRPASAAGGMPRPRPNCAACSPTTRCAEEPVEPAMSALSGAGRQAEALDTTPGPGR